MKAGSLMKTDPGPRSAVGPRRHGLPSCVRLNHLMTEGLNNSCRLIRGGRVFSQRWSSSLTEHNPWKLQTRRLDENPPSAHHFLSNEYSESVYSPPVQLHVLWEEDSHWSRQQGGHFSCFYFHTCRLNSNVLWVGLWWGEKSEFVTK